MQDAKKRNRLCGSCAAKRRKGDSTLNLGMYAKKGFACDEKNPFFGHEHTEQTKEKIRNRDKSFFQTQSYKDKVSKNSSGSKNGMYGRTYYQVWVEKYGKEEADRRQKEKNKKTSIQCTGKNNPMYGKPSPKGSGNGWSGWYKGWFFRSLLELSYVVNVLEPNGDDWESAESLNIKIPYKNYKGVERTYTPDFLINSKTLVEVKPSKLKSSLTVRLKAEAAKTYCKQCNWKYVFVDPPILTEEKIKELHNESSIKFIKRYEKIYEQKYS
jgi:hypothetical protein